MERAQPLRCKPEMATLNCGSLNFGDDVFINTRSQIRGLAGQIRAAESIAELECYEVGHVEEALNLAREGVIVAPLHFQFVLGVPGGIGAREDVLRFLTTLVPSGATWGVAAVGRFQQPMTELAMRLGGPREAGDLTRVPRRGASQQRGGSSRPPHGAGRISALGGRTCMIS